MNTEPLPLKDRHEINFEHTIFNERITPLPFFKPHSAAKGTVKIAKAMPTTAKIYQGPSPRYSPLKTVEIVNVIGSCI